MWNKIVHIMSQLSVQEHLMLYLAIVVVVFIFIFFFFFQNVANSGSGGNQPK